MCHKCQRITDATKEQKFPQKSSKRRTEMFSNFSNQDITGKAKRMSMNWLEANQKRWKS